MEVPPKSLSPESSLLATFATTNSSGIILAALGKDVEKASWSRAPMVSSCDPQREVPFSNTHGAFLPHMFTVAISEQLCVEGLFN